MGLRDGEVLIVAFIWNRSQSALSFCGPETNAGQIETVDVTIRAVVWKIGRRRNSHLQPDSIRVKLRVFRVIRAAPIEAVEVEGPASDLGQAPQA